jgi:hypothetical protein
MPAFWKFALPKSIATSLLYFLTRLDWVQTSLRPLDFSGKSPISGTTTPNLIGILNQMTVPPSGS